jgi:hypothetical protein
LPLNRFSIGNPKVFHPGLEDEIWQFTKLSPAGFPCAGKLKEEKTRISVAKKVAINFFLITQSYSTLLPLLNRPDDGLSMTHFFL